MQQPGTSCGRPLAPPPLKHLPPLEQTGQFHESAMELFGEDKYVSPQYKMRFVRLPLGRPGAVYAMQEVPQTYARPTAADIYGFISKLFNTARLSSECSVVCLIYVERLMEKGNVPLTAVTWRPVILCGLLLSHKVWQDHACWNIEFAQVYPQFSLAAINRLEKRFLERINVSGAPHPPTLYLASPPPPGCRRPQNCPAHSCLLILKFASSRSAWIRRVPSFQHLSFHLSAAS